MATSDPGRLRIAQQQNQAESAQLLDGLLSANKSAGTDENANHIRQRRKNEVENSKRPECPSPFWMLALCLAMPATGGAVQLDPVLRGSWTNLTVLAIAVQGDYAYVATRPRGFSVLDVRNRAEPREVGSCPTLGNAMGMAVAGNYAYVVEGTNGLQVIDISNPAAPQNVGSYDTADARGVAVSGQYGFVADYTAGLQIIDIANAANPRTVGAYDSAGSALDVAVVGSYAYLVGGTNCLQVIDIAKPAAPRLVGRSAGPAQGVVARGNTAYVTSVLFVDVVDISDPANPQRIARCPRIGAAGTWGLAVSATYLFAAISYGSPGLQVIDISDPADPQTAGVYLDPLETGFGDPHAVAVSGNYAYIGGYLYGNGYPLLVIDISNPANPQRIGRSVTTSHVTGVATSGDYAYISDDTNGLQVIDISNPAAPRRVGGYDTGGSAWGVALAGNYACVDYGTGLQVIDISNPAAPKRVGAYEISGSTAQDVVVAGNYAYLRERDIGLQIIEISDPAMPRRVGTYATIGIAWGLAVAGMTAYIGDWGFGLEIVDISNPAMPRRVGGYPTAGRVQGVTVSGIYAYVLEYLGKWITRFQVLDISNQANPQRIGSYDIVGSAAGVALSGNYAYVPDVFLGLHVIDVSNPANPRRAGANKSFVANSAVVSGGKVLVAAGAEGLIILNVFRPLSGPPISLSATVLAPIDTLRLSVQGLPGLTVQIERSSDLAIWQSLTNVPLGSVPIEVTDSDAALNSRQFYRAFAR